MQYLILCAFSFDSLKKYPILRPIINGPKDNGRFKKENERRHE